jgi:hypothetical protein
MVQLTRQYLISSFASLLLVGVLIVSCRDATAPPDPQSEVTVDVAYLASPSLSSDSSGRQLIACDLTLQANNAALQGAVWLDATFAFYLQSDSTSPFAVDTLPAAVIGTSWGSDTIRAGSAQTARWHVAATVPFALRIRFSYRMARGEIGTKDVAATCEPATAPGPPPVITTLTSGTDTLQPGDTLHLSYAATSSVGLWQTVMHITGPCDTAVLIPEQLQTAVAHDLAIVIPARCALGVPLAVTASAFDARLQGTSRGISLPAFVDHRAPTLGVLISTSYNALAPPSDLADYLFAGDGIGLLLTAADNHSLGAIYWDVLPSGFRDSTLAGGPSAYLSEGIVTQSSWAGPLQLRLYAKDAAGNVSDTVVTAPGGIQVYPTVGPSPTPVSISGDITDAAFDTKRGLIYLLQSNADQIAVFSPASGTVVRTIPVAGYAPAIDLTPSGDSLITVLMNVQELGVVDLTQSTPTLTTTPLPGLDSTDRLLDVRVTSTGQAMIAIQHQVVGGVTRLYLYSLADGTLQVRLDAPELGNNFPGMLERTTDGTVVIVNGAAGAFLRYDATTDQFGSAQTARIEASRPSLDGTAAHLTVGGGLYDAGLQYLRSVRVAQNGNGPGAISPDGQTHYMALAPGYTERGVVRSQVSDGAIEDHIAVPMIIGMLRVSPDGSMLLAIGSENGSTEICLVNLLQLH